jgi:iron complex outermembrane receptor protein
MARTNRITGRWPLISLLTLGFAMPAMAQTPAAPAGPQTAPQAAQERDTRDVVVVTANKREESVQDIAVAVTAISSAVRDQIGLTTVQDYTNFAPGLSYSTASDRLGMRGVTRTSNNFGIRSGISNYVDGIYYSSAIPASKQPIFVDRVEVVRGPQGTLYGRDSIGGALNVISKRPSDTFTSQFNVGVDNWDSTKIEGRVSGPITDWLRYSVGASKNVTKKGFFTNYSGLETEGGRDDGYYIEAQLAGNIGDSFDWWISTNRLEWNRKGAPGARTGVGALAPYDTRYYDSTADIAPNGWFGLTTSNRLQTGTQNTNPTVSTDRRGFNTDFTNFAKLRPTDNWALEAVYHMPSFDIKYLGGYAYYNYDLQQDQDGTSISQYVTPRNETVFSARVSDYQENRGWFSNEINFISTGDGPWQWTTGLYAYQENYSQTVFVGNLQNPGGPIYDSTALTNWLSVGGPLLGVPRPSALPELQAANGRNSASGAPFPGASLVFFTDNEAVNNSYGAFFQTDYKITDQLKLTGGLRYSGDYSRGREFARIVNHYVVEDALESAFIAGYTPTIGAGAAAALVPGFVPPRIDVTRALGGADPSTVTTANPCGFAGRGILNTNVTAANGATTATGGCASTDKSRFGIYYDALTGNGYRDMAASWHAINGIVGLDWTPDTDTLVYAKYNRGYKPGGFGAADVFGILAPTPYTDKETVDAVEFGIKREWRDWNLTTDVVAYYDDYKGYQTTNLIIPPVIASSTGTAIQPSSYTAYLNIPKTEITGLEIETTWRPLDNLRILFNYGFNNPEIKKAPPLIHALDPYALDPAAKPSGSAAAFAAPNTRGQQTQDITGNLLPFSPKNKIAINGVYTMDFQDGSKLDWSASYFWQDIAFSSIFNRSYTKIPAWDQEDVRLSWTSADRHFTLIGFGKNIFDNTVYDNRGAGLLQSANGTGRQVSPTQCASTAATTSPLGGKNAQSCYFISETLRPPRTYGIELQFHY